MTIVQNHVDEARSLIRGAAQGSADDRRIAARVEAELAKAQALENLANAVGTFAEIYRRKPPAR